jgi:hypothetical protein
MAFKSPKTVVRLSPVGYVDANNKIHARHVFAAIQMAISVFFYGLLFFSRYLPRLTGAAPPVPTLGLLLVLAMLVCWAYGRF